MKTQLKVRKAINHRTSDKLTGARRRFGQNFLVDKGCASKIVDLASVEPSDTVLEIGPGRGAITGLLAEKGCQVVALEIDRDLVSFLSGLFQAKDNVSIIEGDALKFDFTRLVEMTGGRMKVIANLPYNVATPILFRLLEARRHIAKMVLMFQQEVAERITAPPGSKRFGALSIFPQLYSDISIVLTLPPAAFKPKPKVNSSVLVFDLLDESRFMVEDEVLLKRIVSAAFSQRRKKFSNTLKTLLKENELRDRALAMAGIDGSRRAETLSVEEFCRLCNVIHHVTA